MGEKQDPLYDCKASDGLQILKDKWGQKSYFGEQSEYLEEHLDEAFEATEKKAPKPRQDYGLGRFPLGTITEDQRERTWENTIWQRWRVKSGPSEINRCWYRIVAYQVPLFATQEKSHWGYIDLLGFLGDGTPSVIELKKDPKAKKKGHTDKSESPLRMVMEAAAYAIALRKNWDAIRSEYAKCLKSYKIDGPKPEVPDNLEKIQLVGAAPASYWLDCSR